MRLAAVGLDRGTSTLTLLNQRAPFGFCRPGGIFLVWSHSRMYAEEFTKLGTRHALMLFVLHAKVHAQH